MTIIATDGKSMAADGFGICNDIIVSESDKKLFRHNESIFGCCGNSDDHELFKRWLEEGASRENLPKLDEHFGAVELAKDGIWLWFNSGIRTPTPAPYAMGSGQVVGLTALKMGKSPREAVEMACALCVNCGGDILEMSLEERPSLVFNKISA